MSASAQCSDRHSAVVCYLCMLGSEAFAKQPLSKHNSKYSPDYPIPNFCPFKKALLSGCTKIAKHHKIERHTSTYILIPPIAGEYLYIRFYLVNIRLIQHWS